VVPLRRRVPGTWMLGKEYPSLVGSEGPEWGHPWIHESGDHQPADQRSAGSGRPWRAYLVSEDRRYGDGRHHGLGLHWYQCMASPYSWSEDTGVDEGEEYSSRDVGPHAGVRRWSRPSRGPNTSKQETRDLQGLDPWMVLPRIGVRGT
jgi:hypothetical protein